LKKHGNSKFSHFFIQFLFFTGDDSFTMFSALRSMNKILEKMKINDGIEIFSFNIEKVWKMFF